MRGREQLRESRTRAVFVTVAVLLGLFAMHGLSTHGSNTHPSANSSASAATSAATSANPADHAGASAMRADTTVANPTDAAEHQSGHESGDGNGHESSLLGMCLAILAGLALTLGLMLRGGRLRLPASMLPRLSIPPLPTRERAPPHLDRLHLRLCVIRC